MDTLTDLQEKNSISEELKNYTLTQYDTVLVSTANTISIPAFSLHPQSAYHDHESIHIRRLPPPITKTVIMYGNLMPIESK